MSRRKQPAPNKVRWEQVFAGLEGHSWQAAMMKRDFQGLLGAQGPSAHAQSEPAISRVACLPGDSEADEETTQEEVSSPASEEDGRAAAEGPVKRELGPTEQLGHRKQIGFSASQDTLIGLSQCPLCQLECGSREQLVSHVYQHTAAAAVSAKSYLCPVCGRALSSPGSLGRHLLIHSEDQLSNCAVCGACFTSHATFNSEKVPEVLCGDALPVPLPEGSSGTQEKNPANAPATPGALAPTVYPAGILLVCNSCVAYRKLLEAQAPGVRKWAVRRQNEPLEARLQRLERERTAKKSRRDNETPEEREVRRMRDREAKRLQRLQETDEQRARRLQRDREAMRLKRANETPEKRQARLIREREAKRLKRRLEKMDMMLRAQFGQDSSAMAALAAEMNFFPLPVGSMELDGQLLGKMAFEEPNASALH
ncbi:zinc finger protein 821 [Sceloporus undulatus]|uniref:zinc finger protein 821 n=1 Tax=Sceloporus undulatus TaxID=8520 RepID=UPI001C4B8B68|nr:zinc finger protein 821 [Sceloporus undulatus]